LHNNKEALLERKILYPETGCKKNGIAHHELANFLASKQNFDEGEFYRLQNQLVTESYGCEAIIISSEAFQNIVSLDRVKAFFKPFAKLVVVVYLREYIDYLQTAYAQKVHYRGYKSTFRYYVETQNVYGKTLNYRKFVEGWKSIADDMKICLYQRNALRNKDIVSDFFYKVDIDCENLEFASNKANPSIGGNLLYFKLCLNYLGVGEEGEYYRALSKLALKDKRYKSGFYIDDETIKALRKKFSMQNEYLEELFPSQVDYKHYSMNALFPDRKKLVEDIDDFLRQDVLRGISNEFKSILLDLESLTQIQSKLESAERQSIYGRILVFMRKIKA